MGKLILYGTLPSPPVRSALLVLHALGLEFEFVNIDLMGGETKTDDFSKINPQRTIPVLEDDGQYIWDSHAIAAYLVRKYGKTDALYPKDPYQRAVVDQRLHFDTGVMFPRALKGFMSPHLSKQEKIAGILETYNFLEAFLENTYLAGDHLTIADLSIVVITTNLNAIIPISESGKTPKLSAWLELMKTLPYYAEVNGKGLAVWTELLTPMIDAFKNES